MDSPLVIIGAGPAGLTAALEAQKLGLQCLVLEADPTAVGGLSRTVEYNGYRFDIGGHRFYSKSAEIEELWTEIMGEEMLSVARRSRIFYAGKFYDYPLKIGNALRNLGPLEALRCLLSYLKARLRPVCVKSFEDWVSNQFGHRLYSIFFRTYTEKVWGIPCREISADWASQRIRGLNLWTAAWSALGFAGQGSIRTLIDRFRYPRLGPGQMWQEAAEKVRQAGGKVSLGRKVTRIVRDQSGVTAVEAGGEVQRVGYLISTMPLRQLVEALEPAAPDSVLAAARALHYRDFLTVVLIVKDRRPFFDNWIYIHDPSVRVGRVQNYKNWSRDLVPDPTTTSLGLEYFCFEGDGLWAASDGDLIALGTSELAQLGLCAEEDVLDGTVMRIHKAYPVYDHLYHERVETVRCFLEEQLPNVQVAGRNGMHRYNNQDHAMMTGLLAVRNLAGLGPFNLWNVNSEAEYLEDAGGQRLVPRRLSVGTN